MLRQACRVSRLRRSCTELWTACTAAWRQHRREAGFTAPYCSNNVSAAAPLYKAAPPCSHTPKIASEAGLGYQQRFGANNRTLACFGMSPGRPLADGDQLRGHPETLLETGWQGLDLTFEQAGGSPGLHDSPFAAQTVQWSPTFSCSYTLVTAPGPALRACPWEEEACIVRNLKQHSLTAGTPTPSGRDPCARPRPSIQKSHRQVYPWGSR